MFCISLCRKYAVTSKVVRMTSSYKEAINKLNSLQSNKSTLEQIRREMKNNQNVCRNLENMENYLKRTGVTMSQLDQLSVIHVAGTKGKGSTSAMCESILRQHGFRTGFFSSPHLVAVRERIRVDGRLVTEHTFAEYFHQIFDMLHNSKTFEDDMPKYFAFLTVLAFHVFLREKVDVAIVEVGIGGVVDYTNVLRKVPIVGITALGLDHTSILGDTITEIAAAKAGIMKPSCQAYTVQQPPAAMDVLRKYADSVNCSLHIVPDYDAYKIPKNIENNPKMGLHAYQTNMSLAIQLAHAWMRHVKSETKTKHSSVKLINGPRQRYIEIDTPILDSYKNKCDISITTEIPNRTLLGLQECKWPGRYQVIKSNYATFFIDGAHTRESIEICAQWFMDQNRCRNKILIFSCTGDREAIVLLEPFINFDFESVFFVIPTAFKNINENHDNFSMTERRESLEKCQKTSLVYKELVKERVSPKVNVLECVADALKIVKKSNNDSSSTSVLITGSLHLVGAALSILDPNLCNM